jgi:glycosyltransferase involved in cell wall biosynthesis
MKKVLIVGYPWPYIGGSKRVMGLSNYLPEHGWEPIILTAPLSKKPPSHLKIIETGYRGLLGSSVKVLGLNDRAPLGEQLKERVRSLSPLSVKMLRLCFDKFREVYAYPDEHKRWKIFATNAAEEAFAKEPFHAILSIWPVTSHLIAKDLKLKLGIPWIADLADLWSDNSAYPYGAVRKWVDTQLEKKTLRYANILTTSSKPLAERLSRIHPGKKIGVSIIGFDPKIINTPPAPLKKNFTIIYTGVFYWQKRDPYPFFKALSQFITEEKIDTKELNVEIYGPDQGWVKDEIRKNGVSEIVKQFPSVPYKVCIQKQRESHLLLQINWNDVNERGVFSGKLLDYLAAGRPILAAGGSGNDEVVIDILRKTGAGVYAVKVSEIKDALQNFWREYHLTGKLQYNGNWSEVEKFSDSEMANNFASYLNEVV